MSEELQPENEFLRELFDELNHNDLGYCVLRNYESLPYNLGGSDLDLAVLPEHKQMVADIVLDIAQRQGGVAITDYVSSGRMIRLLGCNGGTWWGAAVDLFWKMEYKGVEYIPTKRVIERASDYRGIKVAGDYDASLIALVKELLSNGKTRKDYFPEVVKIYRERGPDSFEVLQGSIGSETIDRISQLLDSDDDSKESLYLLAKQLRADVIRRKWIFKLGARARNTLSKYQRIIRPPGYSIAVLGTDGSGKTTMINAVTPLLEQALHSKIQYEHLRPNWLPPLGVATGKRPSGDGAPVTDPHSQKNSGFVGSLIRLVYYATDYTVGYWMKVYPRLVKRPHICLFDRYYYDFILDPCRMRIALPSWIIHMALILAPQPRLILCLGGEPEVVYARKPETSLVEVSRQVDELKKLCVNNKRAVWIDTGVSVKDSRDQVLRAVQSALTVHG